MTDHSPPRVFNLADEEVVAYRGLSALAVVGLLGGLLSPLALFAWILWWILLPVPAVCALALWQIAVQAPNLDGRKLALSGLLLSVTFLVAAPTSAAVYRQFIRREAREFAGTFFEHVRNGETLAAHELTLEPRRRAPLVVPPDMSLSQYLAQYYSKSDYHRKMLDIFKTQTLLHTLFALGPAAEYRYYETAEEGTTELGDWVKLTYAVTCLDKHDRRTTFFITAGMSRKIDPNSHRCNWTMGHIEGPVRPPGW